MNGKYLIDLSISGDTRPGKRTEQCINLPRAGSGPYRQVASAGSHLSAATLNQTSNTPQTMWSSRATSAVTRGLSAVTGVTSTASRRSSTRRNRSFHREGNWSAGVLGLEWKAAGNTWDFSLHLAGLNVWTLEDHQLHKLSANDHGFFHQGNCYLVLQYDDDGCTFLHVWSGSQSLQTDQDIAQIHARDLDKSLGGASFMSLEYEGHETPTFLKHFKDGIIIVEGKSKQSLQRSVKYLKRLYLVQGRGYSSATCIECCPKAATVNSVLILDGSPRMYLWVGQEVDFVFRVKAIKLAKKIRTWQRNSKSHIVVIDQNNKQMNHAFLRKLDSDKPLDINAGDHTEEKMTNYKPHLYKIRFFWTWDHFVLYTFGINGERVLCDMPLVSTQPLQQKYLTTMDSFLLDMGSFCPLYIWVGNNAESETLNNALHCAESFGQHHHFPSTVPVCRVMEGSETGTFKKAFIDWKDRTPKDNELVRSYHITNIEKVLFSKIDHHTVAKLSKSWPCDQFLTGNGTLDMWQVNGEILTHLRQEQHRILYKNHSYVILYKENISGEDQLIIYFWQGSKASSDCQKQAEKLAVSMDSIIGHKTVIIRILDGREPQHFLTALRRSIIVYDPDLRKDDTSASICCSGNSINQCSNTYLFCVQEVSSECVRVSQVPPVSTSLNSSAAYVLISGNTIILWYGKISGACEREYSKTIPAYLCPERSRDYKIIIEGKETATFWSLVQHIGDYPKQFPKPVLQKQSPVLALCSRRGEKWFFIDIPDFSQEDLCDTDIFILDLHDQIQLWTGSSVVNRDHEVLSSAIEAYIDFDPAGRKVEDLQLVFCIQDHEPPLFKMCFKSWDSHGYGGELTYEAARKRLRQENASINIDSQMIDMTYLDTAKISYKLLVKGQDLPSDVDKNHKEHYLSDEEFTAAFRMTRNQFYRLPVWKQKQILRSSRIAPLSCNSQSSLSPVLRNLRL